MDNLIVILSVLVTGGLWLRFLYKYDRVEPEPIKVLLKIAILGGFLSAICASIINAISGKILGFHMDGGNYGIIRTALFSLAVGFNEEFMKAFFTYFFTKDLQELDEPIDAVIYSTAVALGFAVIENFEYTFSNGLVLLGLRTFTAMPLHIGLAVIWGVSIARVRFFKGTSYSRELKSTIILAALIHAGYDFIVFYVKNPYITIFLSIAIAFFLIKSMDKTLKYLLGQTPFLPAGTCTNCGEINSINDKTCKKCNFNLVQEYFLVCPGCGTKLPNSFEECTSCGTILNQKTNLVQEKRHV